MTFFLSFSLLIVLGLVVTLRLSRSNDERFWFFWGAVSLQLSVVACALSLVYMLSPWMWIAAQVGAAGFVIWWWRQPGKPLLTLPPVTRPSEWNVATRILGGILVVLCLASLWVQFSQPIPPGDARNYHASRVIYWIQNASLLAYPSHNDRQVTFGFGGELFFLWPVLHTKSELIGRLIFWLGFPLSLRGLFILSRALGARTETALGACVVFAAAPIVFEQTIGLKPELWLTFFVLGFCYWMVRATEPGETGRSFLCAGIFLGLSISAKFLALALVVPAAVFALVTARNQGRSIVWHRAVVGLILGVLASGVVIPLVQNLVRDGHPMGSATFRKQHSAQISLQQVKTHLIRLPMLLLELPELPQEAMAQAVGQAGNRAIELLDASRPLEREKPDSWPGLFTFSQTPVARRYSTGGMLLLPLLWIGLVKLGEDLVRTAPRFQLRPIGLIALSILSFLIPTILSVRWMVHSGVPDRFLVAPFAASMALGGALLATRLQRSAGWQALAVVLLTMTVYTPIRAAIGRAIEAGSRTYSREWLEAPYMDALTRIPAGSRILFVGNPESPDYALFAPHLGYANTVVSWGKEPFSPQRVEGLLRSRGITHVLMERAEVIPMDWDPPLQMAPLVKWLEAQPGTRRIPIPGSPLVLFTTGKAGAAQEGVAGVLVSKSEPKERPLMTVEASAAAAVGIGVDSIRGKWQIEAIGDPPRAFQWIGSGQAEGLNFSLVAKRPVRAELVIDLVAGPSRKGLGREIQVAVNKKLTNVVNLDAASGVVRIAVDLSEGLNEMELFSNSEADVAAMPNGDTRHLIVGLNSIRIHVPTGTTK
jgi:hypothetical protein